MFQIEEELKKLPAKPGVYIMHDRDDAIIYVGKAISLRNRVRSYFRESTNKSPKIEKMVTKIARFEYIVTDSELEALVLENNLIKEHNPKYNTMLKENLSLYQGDDGRGFSKGAVFPTDEKGQIPVFRPVYLRVRGEGHHRADQQAV